jgi:hypothetical protein
MTITMNIPMLTIRKIPAPIIKKIDTLMIRKLIRR